MNAGRKPRVAEVLQGIYNSGMEWQRRAIEAEAQVSALTAECDALAQQLQQAQAQTVDVRKMSVGQLKVVRDTATNRLYEIYCADLDKPKETEQPRRSALDDEGPDSELMGWNAKR